MRNIKIFNSFNPRTKCYEPNVSTISSDIQPSNTEQQTELKEPLLKCRYIIAIMGFFIYFSLNAYRINMSVTIVAMVNQSAITGRTKMTSESCKELLINVTRDKNDTEIKREWEEGEFAWSPEIQGYILGSYFFSYVIVQIPTGKLAERYGCKWLLFWGSFIAAVGSFVMPVASRFHAYALIVVQALRGIVQGFIQPASSVLTANWFPKMERGLLYPIMLSGASLGTCLGSIFSGLLCKLTILGGWPSSFYIFGSGGLVLSIFIIFFIHESPDVHPRISQGELKYILSNQENALTKRRPNPPWRKIFSSVPVYALALAYFGQMWSIAQFLIVHSTFLGTILHYSIEQNGYLSALPFLLMFICVQISCWLTSLITTRKYATVDQMRKFWNLLACLGFSGCLLGIYFAGCNRTLSITFAILSVGFTGFGMSGCWIVSTDMSPTFAGCLNAICGCFGYSSSFILPLVVGYLTDEMQTIEQWNKVFFISIGVVMSSGIIFSVFGSAKVQPWNYMKEAPNLDKNENTRF